MYTRWVLMVDWRYQSWRLHLLETSERLKPGTRIGRYGAKASRYMHFPSAEEDGRYAYRWKWLLGQWYSGASSSAGTCAYVACFCTSPLPCTPLLSARRMTSRCIRFNWVSILQHEVTSYWRLHSFETCSPYSLCVIAT